MNSIFIFCSLFIVFGWVVTNENENISMLLNTGCALALSAAFSLLKQFLATFLELFAPVIFRTR